MTSRRQHLQTLLAFCLVVLLPIFSVAAAPPRPADLIAALIQPQKLATLGKRAANPRVQKAVYQLALAQQHGRNPTALAQEAIKLAGYSGPLASQLTVAALLRNLDIASKLGCLDKAGLAEMRRGRAPTVRNGPYRGDQLSVDHIIPRAVCPELDNVIANLELMPLRMNESKNAAVGSRQLQQATDFHRAGLLTTAGLQQVRRAAK